jgi:hypothetical protein
VPNIGDYNCETGEDKTPLVTFSFRVEKNNKKCKHVETQIRVVSLVIMKAQNWRFFGCKFFIF